MKPMKRPVSFFSALAAVLWGSWLLNPFLDSFALYARNFEQMNRIASEEAWGAFLVLAGTTLWLGMWRRSKWLRRLGAMGILIIRIFTLVLSGIQNNWSNSGLADFAVWVLMALYCLIRAGDE